MTHNTGLYSTAVTPTHMYAHTHMQDSPKDLKHGCLPDTPLFDKMIQSQVPSSTPYLAQCRRKKRRHHINRPQPDDDDVIITSSPKAQPHRPRMKLLQFHANVRPPYFGSWRKKSDILCGRTPFKKDTVCTATVTRTYCMHGDFYTF